MDIIPEKVDLINNRKSPIQDDYIEKYLAEKELKLTATLDAKAAYSDADFVVIAAPRLAIVILNYNCAKDTMECIDSILRQEDIEIETIIVDNGSTDDSVNVLTRRFGDTKENAHYIISAFAMFVLTHFLARHLQPSIISTFVCIVFGAAAYLGILAMMKDDMLLQVRKILEAKFIK